MAHRILRWLGVIWHGLMFGILLPVCMALVGLTLDAELQQRWGISLSWSWPLAAAGVLLLISSATLLLVSVFTLHHYGKGFPWSFGPHAAYNPQVLVTQGPYAAMRHPMATGYLLFLTGIACLLPSLVMLVWLVPITGGLLYEYYEFTEEKQLLRWFGKDYERYHQRTPSLIPRLAGRHWAMGQS